MVGRNITAAIEAQNTKIDAKFDAMESKINTLRTMIAWGLAAIGPLVAALRLFA